MNALRSRGFTLIELLISMVIVLIVFLALDKALILYIKINVLNALRNEAITLAQSCVEDLRVGNNCPDNYTFVYRNYTVNYIINAPAVNSLDNGTADNVSVTVNYSYAGSNFSYKINTMVYKGVIK